MNNKEIAIMKLFKAYLLEDSDEIDNDCTNIDKESLKKRNLYK